MSRRRIYFRLVAVAVLLLLTLFWWMRSKSSDTEMTGSMDSMANDNPSQHGTPLAPQQAAKRGLSKRDAFALLPTLTAARIEFYGKVVDQDGKPMAGVEVLGATGSATGFMQHESRQHTTNTAADGLFTFQGFSGGGLNIVLKKAGYNYGSNRKPFVYASMALDKKLFKPERAKPVIFQMWKSLGSEPLISYYGESVTIPIDGKPVLVDLKKGAKAKGAGDLLISILWGPRKDSRSYDFDWSVKLEVPDGGIMKSPDDQIFIAPIEGYDKNIEYHFTAQDKGSQFTRTYYVMSRNGSVFSRVEISLTNNPIDSRASATFRVQLNPKPGSRNLEYDPEKRADGP